MTASNNEKVEHLNSAAEVLVQSYNEVEKEGEKHKDNEVYKDLKQKVDKAYESCANQQKVTQDIFTEPDEEKKVMPLRQLNFTAPRHISINHNDKANNVLSRGKDAESTEVFSCDQCGKSCGNSTNFM